MFFVYDKVVDAIKNSNSIAGCFKYMGYASVQGKMYSRLRGFCQDNGIELVFNKKPRSVRSRELKEYLVEDIQIHYSTDKLKKCLIKEGLLDSVCYICSNSGIWNGKSLSLQLDHINGNRKDNRIENLRILCPNCHAQTDTYAGKRLKKEPTRCVICSATVSNRSRMCLSCYRSNRRVVHKIHIPKDLLLDLILTKSMVEIAREYGVSDNCIRNKCKSYKLPYLKNDIDRLRGLPKSEIYCMLSNEGE